jgi:hypothetical protein
MLDDQVMVTLGSLTGNFLCPASETHPGLEVDPIRRDGRDEFLELLPPPGHHARLQLTRRQGSDQHPACPGLCLHDTKHLYNRLYFTLIINNLISILHITWNIIHNKQPGSVWQCMPPDMVWPTVAVQISNPVYLCHGGSVDLNSRTATLLNDDTQTGWQVPPPAYPGQGSTRETRSGDKAWISRCY